MDEIDRKIIDGIERISEAIRLASIKEGLRLSLSPTQLKILELLCKKGPKKQSEIILELGLDKTTVSKSLKSLQKKRFIKVVRDSSDARAKKVIPLVKVGNNRVFSSLLKVISKIGDKADKEKIYAFIYEIICEFYKNGIINYQRMCALCIYGRWKGKKFYCSFLGKYLDIPDLMIDCPDFLPIS